VTDGETGPPNGRGDTGRRTGRQPASSRSEIEHVAFRLFDEQGFEQTTVDDIAAAVGIARRTFFGYFPSKNDVPWGSFDRELELFREVLDATPSDMPVMEAVRCAVLRFNTVPAAEQPWHRRRLALILGTPALQAHSTLRYAEWRQVIVKYAAPRLGVPESSIVVQTIAYTALGVAIAAYDVWLRDERSDLLDLLDRAFRVVTDGPPQAADRTG
jgi:mycofactocin system transcriptional regulator